MAEFKVVISRHKQQLHVERIADELEWVAGYLRREGAILTDCHNTDGYVTNAETTEVLLKGDDRG